MDKKQGGGVVAAFFAKPTIAKGRTGLWSDGGGVLRVFAERRPDHAHDHLHASSAFQRAPGRMEWREVPAERTLPAG